MAVKGIPSLNTADRTFNQLQGYLQSTLQPLIKSPLANVLLIQSVTLQIGVNSINHGLPQKLTGWFITRMRTVYAQIQDLQDSNPNADTTLLLTSNVQVIVDLAVF